MTGADPEFLGELVQTYLEDAAVQLETMRKPRTRRCGGDRPTGPFAEEEQREHGR